MFGCKRVNYDEMDGDRLRLPANRNCYRLSRVSWALLKLLVTIHLVIYYQLPKRFFPSYFYKIFSFQ